MAIVAGVDEAGKGPVIGPMVVAGVAIQQERLPELEKLGLRDSKLHSPRQRERLYVKIKSLTSSYELLLSAAEIDERRKRQTMNEIAVEAFAAVLDALDVETAFVDAPDVKPNRFRRNLGAAVLKPLEITSEHRADQKYTIVSAASIVAKVRRDSEIENLKHEIGVDFGSGYTSDERTREFLRSLLEKGELPDYVRSSWKTVSEMRGGMDQRLLGEY